METVYIYLSIDGEVTGISFTELEGTIPAKVSDKRSFLEMYDLDSLRYDNGYLVPSLQKGYIKERKYKIERAYEEYNNNIKYYTYGMYEIDMEKVNEASLVNDLTMIEKGIKDSVIIVDSNMLFLTLDKDGLEKLLKDIVEYKEAEMKKLEEKIKEAFNS